jgi:hypothetical protein
MNPRRWFFVFAGATAAVALNAAPFEGLINATLTHGTRADALLYTVGTNYIRVEMTASNWPNPVDIWNLDSGDLTILFPNNRSFVCLPPAEDSAVSPFGMSGVPGFEAGQATIPGVIPLPPMPASSGPLAVPPRSGAMSEPPMMPPPGMMPPPPTMQKINLQDTGQKTNLLGFMCEQFEIKRPGETMDIWATRQLFPFEQYTRNQPHRFSPPMIEEQWAQALKVRKVFPLLASLRFDNGLERFRFEVNQIRTQILGPNDDALFAAPTNYFEIQPLPF